MEGGGAVGALALAVPFVVPLVVPLAVALAVHAVPFVPFVPFVPLAAQSMPLMAAAVVALEEAVPLWRPSAMSSSSCVGCGTASQPLDPLSSAMGVHASSSVPSSNAAAPKMTQPPARLSVRACSSGSVPHAALVASRQAAAVPLSVAISSEVATSSQGEQRASQAAEQLAPASASTSTGGNGGDGGSDGGGGSGGGDRGTSINEPELAFSEPEPEPASPEPKPEPASVSPPLPSELRWRLQAILSSWVD